YDHIQQPYAESIYADYYNPAVDCYLCHNKSTVYFNVTFTTANPLKANISHYANKSNLISPTTNCTLCHKSQANATAWYANLTRHPAKSQDVGFCANCHNSTNITTFHDYPLNYTPAIHGGISNVSGVNESFDGFDFEHDDYNDTGAITGNESCIACHGSASGIGISRLCEGCHLPNTTSLFTGPYQSGLYNLRSDINDTLPYVYSHTYYSNRTGTNITVPSQYVAGMTYQTTCYGYNTTTGEGSCHGTAEGKKTIYGGYYALRESSPTIKNDPAHWTDTIDRMPNTTNCLFCHSQSDQTIRKAWGNATQVNASTMFGATTNVSCYACHTTTGTQPFDFHSSEVVLGGG
ncbi:MAG: hypothetical protein OIN66_18860, partial [Candidatus Methanoperedens sp.]|nr:hypothetical protein [Candidatus Methanoperedens sp.]